MTYDHVLSFLEEDASETRLSVAEREQKIEEVVSVVGLCYAMLCNVPILFVCCSDG